MSLEENNKLTQSLYPWARRYDVGGPLQNLLNMYNSSEFQNEGGRQRNHKANSQTWDEPTSYSLPATGRQEPPKYAATLPEAVVTPDPFTKWFQDWYSNRIPQLQQNMSRFPGDGVEAFC